MIRQLTLPCLLALGLALTPALRADVGVGSAFPKLAEANLEGALPSTQGRVLLVDFWASWCAPCKQSFPALGKLQADYGARGLTVLAISVDDKAAAYAGFIKQHAPGFATLRDRSHNLVAAVRVPTMPTSYLVDRDGRVLSIFIGYHGESTEKQLRAAIEQALSKTPAA